MFLGEMKVKSIFRQSIDNKQKIVIYYVDSKNNLTQRIIQVISMNDGLLLAFCFWRKKVRTFKVDNILSAGPIKKRMGAS
jgi:predicted DNA-binding transcriptional regulator YafY